MSEWLPGYPLRIVMAALLVLFVLAALLQVSGPCRNWRAWKAAKEAQRYMTLEFFTKPSYCLDL